MKVGRKLSKENFKSKREIGADNGVITTRFNNYKFIKISIDNTYKSNYWNEYKKRIESKARYKYKQRSG
jgi:hypothetical protein